MSDKHRNLPLWMVKSNVQSSTKNDAMNKKQPGGRINKITKKKQRERVVSYWMNERELVDTAFSLLQDLKGCCRDGDSSGSDVQDCTCVSESDCDITEQDTVPYDSNTEERTAGQTLLVRHLKSPLKCSETPEKPEDPSQKPDDDDEGLELVREIFFT